MSMNCRIGMNGEQELLRLASIVECSEDAIVTKSPDGVITSWNRAAEQLYGYSATEAIGRNIDFLAPTSKLDEIDHFLAQVTRGESVRNIETRRLRKNGTTLAVSVSVFPMRDQAGSIVGAAAIARDVTSRNEAERRMEIASAALEAAANAVVITDSRGVISWTNAAFTRMSGYSREEITGKTLRVLKSGVHDNAFYRDLWATIRAGNVWQGEVVNRRKDGKLYTEEMTITPVRSAEDHPTHFIAIKQDITARKDAEAALRNTEEKYRAFFENSLLGSFQSTPDGVFLTMNRALAEMYGYASVAEALAKVGDLKELWAEPERCRKAMAIVEMQGEIRDFQAETYRKDGTKIWVSVNVRCAYGRNGEPICHEGIVENISARKILEKQLQQAQKMEAVGRLAGGVAHDFNNMLSIISGYSELLEASVSITPSALHYVEEIHGAAKRAASLTQQLLAFSRKQIIQPRMADLNKVFLEIGNMLRRLIGDDIEIALDLWPSEVIVNADPGQLQQVLMNLAINARDAMPKGGKLTVTTAICKLDSAYVSLHPDVVPGNYALMAVQDTGCGMDSETLSHLFEPFFTTKELGKGTGLGLSIIYGIVKQSEGYIWAYSEPGQGTCFKIYLPLRSAAAEIVLAPQAVTSVHGTETILLVEDDSGLRHLIAQYLRGLGYTVLEAAEGRGALDRAAKHVSNVDALLTDIMMPGMGGRELANHMTEMYPSLKIVYMSGYTHDSSVQSRTLHESEAFLMKPFSVKELAVKLRQVISNRKVEPPSNAG